MYSSTILVKHSLRLRECWCFTSDNKRRTTPSVERNDRQGALQGRSRRAATKRSVRKAGSVGGSRMMECEIVYPGGRYMERIITWRKRGIEVCQYYKKHSKHPCNLCMHKTMCSSCDSNSKVSLFILTYSDSRNRSVWNVRNYPSGCQLLLNVVNCFIFQ